MNPIRSFARSVLMKPLYAITLLLTLSATEALSFGESFDLKHQGYARVHLSPIFKWYLEDFGGTKPDLLRYLRKWLPVEENWSIAWTDYDWSLNEVRR